MKKQFYSLPLLRARLLVLTGLFLFSGLVSFGQYSFNFGVVTPPPATGDPDANSQDLDGLGNPLAIEVGIRFRVTQPGTITAIRFYKGDDDQGTHIGNLWRQSDNANMGNVNFVGEQGAGGWKQQAFITPIPVVPGEIYVASYHSSDGYYAVSPLFFGNSEFGTPPLIMSAHTGTAPDVNGVYLYTPTTAYPTNFFGGSNYWVDVVFVPTFLLPVNLFDLNASVSNKNVVVSWKTSSETNNKGFEVQRSNNNTDWYTINFTEGAGESSSILNYSYTDKALAPGIYYYRIRQIDFDGKPTVSQTVLARVSGTGAVTLYPNYPNPVKSSTVIRFDLPSSQQVRLSLVDLTGREVKLLMNKTGETGTHQVNIDAQGLSRQMYIIRLQTASGILTQKMIVQ